MIFQTARFDVLGVLHNHDHVEHGSTFQTAQLEKIDGKEALAKIYFIYSKNAIFCIFYSAN